MIESYTPEDVRVLVEAALHCQVGTVEQETIGASNATFFVRAIDGSEYVVRITPSEHGDLLLQEVWAYAKSRVLGLPTPDILRVDPAPGDFPAPYVIMNRLPGISAHRARLSVTDRMTVLEQLGGYLARLHTITLPGYGPLIVQDAGYAGRFPSMRQYVRYEYDRRVQALPEDILSPESRDEIGQRLERAQSCLDIPQASLLHGDYQFKNILVEGRQVTGIVDFENLAAGDPVADFVPLHFWSEQPDDDLRAIQRGYGHGNLNESRFMQKLYLYELLLALEILWWEWHFQDTAAITLMQKRIQVTADALDQW